MLYGGSGDVRLGRRHSLVDSGPFFHIMTVAGSDMTGSELREIMSPNQSII